MASQLDDISWNSRQPANQEMSVGDAGRIGNTCQPIVAGKSNVVLAFGIPPSQSGQKCSLDPRSGNLGDHGPGLPNPAQIRQRPLFAQDLLEPIADGMKELNMLMGVD
jgi:hypothetical protein